MSQDRNKIIAALRQGALDSSSQYIAVRREDLLVALGADPPPKPESELKKEAAKS